MEQVTVATLNLRGRHDRWLERRGMVVAELMDEQPDLISLQEIYRPIGQARWLRNQINSRLGPNAKGYQLVQRGKDGLFAGLIEGVGILARLPILSHDSVSLGFGGRVAVRVSVELISGEPLDFVATHLHHVAEHKEARLEQVMRLCGWLNEHNPAPFQIIAGDFNEVPDGPAIKYMRQTFLSAFVEYQGHDPLATYPTALVKESVDWAGCLDYIFVSKALGSIVEARLFCKRSDPEDPTLFPSDHVGLLSTLNTTNTPGINNI